MSAAPFGRLAAQLTRALARPVESLVESVAASCAIRRRAEAGTRADGSTITAWATVHAAFPLNVTALAAGYAERRYGVRSAVVAEGVAPMNGSYPRLREGDGVEVKAGDHAGRRMVVVSVDPSGLVIQTVALREAKPGEAFV